MGLIEEIQSALKEKKAIAGYKESLEFVKNETPKLIVVANNMPEDMRKDLEHNARISRSKIEMFDGSSRDLGVICGRPFPIMMLVIKK